MKFLFPRIIIILIGVIYNICPIHSQHPQKYDFVKLIQGASTRINANRNFKNFANGNVHPLDEFKTLFKEKLNPTLLGFLVNNEFGGECIRDFVYVFENLRSPDGWASKMIDSYGKPESGILQGNLKWYGDFNECVNIYAPPQANNTLGNFRGKYCVLQVTVHLVNMSLALNVGTCLPDSCNPPEANKTQQSNLEIASPQLQKESGSIFSDVSFACQRTNKKFNAAARAMICLISLFLLLAAIGSSITAFESFTKPDTSKDRVCITGLEEQAAVVNGEMEKQSLNDDDTLTAGNKNRNKVLPIWIERCKPFFNCFCVFTNGAKLLDTTSTEGQLPCLHGIRFLSMTWVIVGHIYMLCFSSIRNILEAVTLFDNLPFQIVLNAFYAVDSFFFLSGFLLAYLYFEQSSKNSGKISWVYFYVHRYIRLTPVYMMVLGFDTALVTYMGSGPHWFQYDTDPICTKNWWYNLLYINNFLPGTEQCISWAWYLGNDMQFFVVSPLLLIPLVRWPIVGYAVMALFLLATCMTNFVLTYQFNLVTGLGGIFSSPDTQLLTSRWIMLFDKVYTKPYTRMSPYLVGIAVAYYLYKRKQNSQGKNNLVTLGCGWLIASTITLACLFGLYHRDLSLLEASFYNAFSRACYAGGLAWIVYVCITGQGGFVNSILSYKLFIPLSRLTYCAYLVHPIVLACCFGSMKTLIYYSHITMIQLFLGCLLIAYGVAFATSLLFESPVIRLEKYVRNTFSRA